MPPPVWRAGRTFGQVVAVAPTGFLKKGTRNKPVSV